jgi:glycosyltransferase involved in cell wall biosynthesis
MVAPRLSVIVITHNERHNIGDCLRSVAFADEWIVVDSGSTDGTAQIAAECGAQVHITSDWPGFGAQKSRALALARGDWVLSIDADERVSAPLAEQIKAVVHQAPAPTGSGVQAYRLARLSSFCGQVMRHGDWYPDHVLRLFRRHGAAFSSDLVHERLVLAHSSAEAGRSGLLAGHLLHNSVPSLDNAIDKMNRYTSGRARDKLRQGGQGGLGKALGHGLWAFIRCYGLKRGFLDGRLGLVLALHVAETTYYRYLKMWLAPRNNEP